MLSLSSLNPQQRLAVETIHGPVLILAGAGTGKTRVITFRIAHLIHMGVPPENILGVTFTNKAAREMQERVRGLLPSAGSRQRRDPDAPPPSRPTLCTFHSLCVKILRQHIDKLGYKRNFVIYDESEQLGAIKKILANINSKAMAVDASEVLSALSKIKNRGTGSSVYLDPDLEAMAQHLRSRYEASLKACNAVDFDDLILLTLDLFKRFPEALHACREKYKYVMVDEYQDTNAAQFELIHHLTSEHRNLCVVGDDDQSIYGWRGAEIANLLEMEKFYPEVKVVKLEQNYRSTNTILRAANALISHNLRRRGKQLWSSNGDGPKITLCSYDDDEKEAQGVVGQIEVQRLARKIPWSQQAILFRTNMQSRALETALRGAGVRYHLIGGQSFFDRREVRDLIAFLKVFLNPNDDISLLRIANVPARGLSEATMERLLAASHERKTSVFAVMKNPAVTASFPAKARDSIDAFVQFIEATHTQLVETTKPEPNLVERWAAHFLQETGYFQELRRLERNPEAAEGRINNIKQMIAGLDGDEVSKSPHDRLLEFLETVTLEHDREEDDEAKGEAVTLITMHSCKGLEFPHVYVVGIEDGLLPHSRSKAEGTLDEERRLFYVAVTRAMKSLVLSHCRSRKKYGEASPCHVSPFLKEIPGDLVEDGDAKANTPVTKEGGKSLFAAMRAIVD